MKGVFSGPQGEIPRIPAWKISSSLKAAENEHYKSTIQQLNTMDHRKPSSEDLDSAQSANLLSEKPKDNQDIPFCGCLSVRYYQPYFDVDTTDVVSRITSSVLYCRREQNFLASIADRPDAYGPFWISTTLVFTLAVASHLNGWLSSWMKGNGWEYNFQSVLTASSLVYGYAFLAPVAIWFIFKQYDATLKFVPVLCLYGYSLTIFLPAVLLCLIPSEWVSWLALILACASSVVFLLRNLMPLVVQAVGKQAAVLLAIVGCIQLSFALCMKFYFFYSV